MDRREAIQIKYSYMNIFLQRLTEQYRQMEKEGGSAAVKHGSSKVPVWLLWWQGEACMPELVRICMTSISRALPRECTELHLLTERNFQEYITIPPSLLEKYRRGVLDITHLSDVIRACLLAEHGGLWLDATYFTPEPIDKQIFESEGIWVQKFAHPLWEADIVQGRWSINLLKGDKGELLFRFWRDALLFYWERHDSLLDYYLTDYVIAVAYENLLTVRQGLEACEASNPQLFALRECINQPYDSRVWEELIRDTAFFKLSYKAGYQDYTAEGQKTYYGCMKEVLQG